jgi:hypothetical protein
MRAPDFLVVGAARAGTTALHYYLRQHPSLFVPGLKEPSFFSFADTDEKYRRGKFAFAVKDSSAYFRLFENAEEGSITGEVSTPYLYLYDKTIRNIKKYHPSPHKLRILMILRDPVERAFSQYMWRVRDGREELSFEEAIRSEKKRMNENYSFDYFYVDRGMYYPQVKAYKEAFSEVKILLFEDFVNDTPAVLRSICRFLGADDQHVFSIMQSVNSSYIPRWNFLGRLITTESRLKFRILNSMPDAWKVGIRQQFDRWNAFTGKAISLSPETGRSLRKLYYDDILKLQELIGRDLSAWRNSDTDHE